MLVYGCCPGFDCGWLLCWLIWFWFCASGGFRWVVVKWLVGGL